MQFGVFVLALGTVFARAEVPQNEPYDGLFRGTCSAWADRPTLAHRDVLLSLASKRADRVTGFLRYALPNAWPAFRDDEKDLVRELAPRWAPPNKMDPADTLRAARSDLARAFRAFREKGLPCLRPWSEFPKDGEKPAMSGGFNQSSYLRLSALLAKFRDPSQLKTKSLTEISREYAADFAPALTRTYAGPPHPAQKDCALDADYLAGGKLPKSHCEDARNDWLGGAGTSMANELNLAFLGFAAELLANWDHAHGFPPDTADPLWHPAGDFEADARAGFDRAVIAHVEKDEKSPASKIRGDLKLRLETVVRLLNARQVLPRASLSEPHGD